MLEFNQFFEAFRGLPQGEAGKPDRTHPKVQKQMWKAIIERIHQQLPSEYRRLRYVGPLPPTDAPLFSPKISDQVRRAHLFFGKHEHDPSDRIRVEIGRRGELEWRILSISSNPEPRARKLPPFEDSPICKNCPTSSPCEGCPKFMPELARLTGARYVPETDTIWSPGRTVKGEVDRKNSVIHFTEIPTGSKSTWPFRAWQDLIPLLKNMIERE